MDETIILEWAYSPNDFFEEPIQINDDQFSISIDNGKIEGRVSPLYTSNIPEVKKRAETFLTSRFYAVSIYRHLSYKLSGPDEIKITPDGKKSITVSVQPISIVMTMGNLDFVVRDKDGNIITDTKRDRIASQLSFAELISRHLSNDPLVAKLVNSFNTSINDRDNELVHLYEIREALTEKFGNEDNTRAQLDISRKEWSKFGQIVNNEPIRQGRHRGKNLLILRDATKVELDDARNFSRLMIQKYLEFLDKIVP